MAAYFFNNNNKTLFAERKKWGSIICIVYWSRLLATKISLKRYVHRGGVDITNLKMDLRAPPPNETLR